MIRALLLSLACVALAVTGKANAQPNVDFYGDTLPDHAIARLGTTRFRHNGPIRKTLATSDNNSTGIVWDFPALLKNQ